MQCLTAVPLGFPILAPPAHSPATGCFPAIFGGLQWNLGEGKGTTLQYSCLENPVDGGAWWAAVHGISKSQTRLSDFTFTFHFHALEKEMATHSSVLAWRIPGTGEPGWLPSMGLHRVGHDWSDLAAAAAMELFTGRGCWKYREVLEHSLHPQKAHGFRLSRNFSEDCARFVSLPWFHCPRSLSDYSCKHVLHSFTGILVLG